MANLQNPGTGTGNNTGNNGNTKLLSNNLNALQVFKQVLAVDNNGAAANVPLITNGGALWMANKLGTTVPDQNHIVLSSSLSAGNANGLAEMNEYLRMGMHITKIQLYASANPTQVFSGSIFIGEMPLNGLPQPTEIMLQSYATTLGGGGYDNTLTISDYPMVVTRNFFLYITGVPASTTLTVTYTVSDIGNTVIGKSTGH